MFWSPMSSRAALITPKHFRTFPGPLSTSSPAFVRAPRPGIRSVADTHTPSHRTHRHHRVRLLIAVRFPYPPKASHRRLFEPPRHAPRRRQGILGFSGIQGVASRIGVKSVRGELFLTSMAAETPRRVGTDHARTHDASYTRASFPASACSRWPPRAKLCCMGLRERHPTICT